MGILRLISSLIVGSINFIVASGSPGPFDKKIPFGFLLKISLILATAGKMVGLKFKFFKFLRIFCLIPKSKHTIGKLSKLSFSISFFHKP